MSFTERLSTIHPIKSIEDRKSLADKIGVSDRTVQRWVLEGGLPKGKELNKIAEVFPDVNIHWLLTGLGDPKVKRVDMEDHIGVSDSLHIEIRGPDGRIKESGEVEQIVKGAEGGARPAVTIPEPGAFDASYFDFVPMAEAHLSAGGGAFVLSEKFKEYYAFRKEWIRRIATSPKSVVLMPIRGASMHPTIVDGDVVMIDTGRTRIFDGQIYALGLNDTIMVKRLENIVGGRIRIISENRTEYPPYEAPIRDVRILGQVIWFARELVPRE